MAASQKQSGIARINKLQNAEVGKKSEGFSPKQNLDVTRLSDGSTARQVHRNAQSWFIGQHTCFESIELTLVEHRRFRTSGSRFVNRRKELVLKHPDQHAPCKDRDQALKQ
jgi:hypothetical protein